jgi:hypothetical protein
MVLFALYKWVIAPLWGQYAELQDQIDQAAFNLQRYQRIAADLPALRQDQQRLRNENPLTAYLIAGHNRSLAAAGLQRQLQELAGKHGGRILSSRALKHQQEGPLETVTLDARLQISVSGLQELIYALETGQPFTRIDMINITARQGRARQQATMIDVRLTISGLRVANAEDRDRG